VAVDPSGSRGGSTLPVHHNLKQIGWPCPATNRSMHLPRHSARAGWQARFLSCVSSSCRTSPEGALRRIPPRRAWDSEHNRTLVSRMPAVTRAEREPDAAKDGKTSYWRPEDRPQYSRRQCCQDRTISDGTSNTILVDGRELTPPPSPGPGGRLGHRVEIKPRASSAITPGAQNVGSPTAGCNSSRNRSHPALRALTIETVVSTSTGDDL